VHCVGVRAPMYVMSKSTKLCKLTHTLFLQHAQSYYYSVRDKHHPNITIISIIGHIVMDTWYVKISTIAPTHFLQRIISMYLTCVHITNLYILHCHRCFKVIPSLIFCVAWHAPRYTKRWRLCEPPHHLEEERTPFR